MSLNIVLVEPEIPQNTGNIIRTCAATGTNLHLVKPLGFSLEDKYLKRSGLDYWDIANIKYYDSFEEVVEKNPEGKFFFATTKVNQAHSDVDYVDNSFIVFGKETKGLPKELIEANLETCIRIPMLDIEKARSLNLSNSVAIVVYEALRQLDYPKMR
ncbi:MULTISPECIES: tRNA (uridine(34)/cytosine(34)/5-carboxymethylaminomethyluridine(34)-2'-O)-methyltransferase TrmL [Romboutsia]|uniref:Putative tRNA (cytidine(34)-2'-O)-methyltransferase n=1 Tax=Romboutsia hominis TaxID=1507512 RepID=A0A2P2BUM6_9FIRM|nr:MULTISPECIES: tRNA (uridine(34)/cytosine(34)/5-carboxymethylaminomethyluridine(34)-2'-O)-methyltransferase TrmL [Romboutsia]MCH1959144.1 tRNA (uridine(34)/cytosine(34)/5-carboxymethylaminomethyluridine(34)-2'-O)-methyltransferase TrmL [Romboutsia hominis]MCH1968264.1 tRNA (uridine(34)/cytosine(34)/5-carboxymethylaminomethyluridine(34)-2'-O)-methyltransferase TrmL [Romboutsia hominis]MDB8789509.1 tRNA (uridine(34)/cytosine(34)/5-carboxymethylaminomethyluridine(34)-2'-O)-methyltransferase TrmL 